MDIPPHLLPMTAALCRVAPALVRHVNGLRLLSPDDLLAALDKLGIEYQFERLGEIDWELVELPGLTEDEVLGMLAMESAGHHGEVLIVTDSCFSDQQEPFTCHSSRLESFVQNYDARGMVFDGDVLFLCEESRTLTIYHHAGGYVHIKFPV